MNLKLTGVGAEPKKIAVLVGLLAVGLFFYFTNSNSSGPQATPASPSTLPPVTSPRVSARPGERVGARVAQKGGQGAREFRPTFKFKEIDPSTIDPTLHLAMLARLQDVQAEAGTRSLFEIGKEPPAEIKVKEPAKIAVEMPFVGPKEPPPPPPPPPDPKAPPIPLKFYGFVNPSKAAVDKRAFFLHGEDIIIAREGETVEKRYKIVRIGVNSAVVEDTQFKSNNQQTLPLEAEMAG